MAYQRGSAHHRFAIIDERDLAQDSHVSVYRDPQASRAKGKPYWAFQVDVPERHAANPEFTEGLLRTIEEYVKSTSSEAKAEDRMEAKLNEFQASMEARIDEFKDAIMASPPCADATQKKEEAGAAEMGPNKVARVAESPSPVKSVSGISQGSRSVVGRQLCGVLKVSSITEMTIVQLAKLAKWYAVVLPCCPVVSHAEDPDEFMENVNAIIEAAHEKAAVPTPQQLSRVKVAAKGKKKK